MPIQRAATSTMLFEFESSFGVPKTAGSRNAIQTLHFNNGTDIRRIENVNTPETFRGNINPDLSWRSVTDVSGNLVVPVDTVNIGYLFKALLGGITPSGSAVFEHEFYLHPTAVLPSFVLERRFADLSVPRYELFTGCKVTSMDISARMGDEELMATFGILGKDSTTGTTAYDANGADQPADNFGDRFNMKDISATLGGSPVSVVKAMSINVNRNLDGDIRTFGGDGRRRDIVESLASITGNIEFTLEDWTILGIAENDTETSLGFTFELAGGDKIEIEIPEVKLSFTSPVITGPGHVSGSADFTGYFHDNSDATALIIRVTNDHPAY